MKAAAIAILTPIFSVLIAALFGMYLDVQEIKAMEPMREKQIDRMEKKLDRLIDYHLNNNDVTILKRGK